MFYQYSLTATTLTALGGLWLSSQLLQLASFIYLHFIHRSTLERYKRSKSSLTAWALVTGSSDGIGKGFAEELCAQGFNVVLHGRNEKKLGDLQKSLQSQWPQTEIKILVLDATQDATDYAKIRQRVEVLQLVNLRVLVNNVGGTGSIVPVYSSFADRTPEETQGLIDLNATFTTQLTRALLPSLTSGGPGLILNISSAASSFPAPYLATYSGTKAYLNAWSRSLSVEMQVESRDVEAIAIITGMVTSSTLPRQTSFTVATPRAMARAALGVVGCGRHEVTPYWPHAVQFGLVAQLPAAICQSMITGILKVDIKEEAERMAKLS